MTVFLRVCVAFVKNAETEMTTVSAPFFAPFLLPFGTDI